MKKLTLLALLLFTPSIALAQSEEPQTGSFNFSSRGTAFGVQATFEGTYRVFDDYVELEVSRATLYVSEHCPYQGKRFITRLRFGLAAERNSEGGWKIETSSLPLAVGQLMSPREEFTLHSLYIQIPKGNSTDLAKRWLVVEIEEEDVREKPGGKKSLGYAYAHSCRDVFLKPRETSSRKERCRPNTARA